MTEGYFYLVSYDISHDRRRTRVAKILKDFGDRVQYSVFELILYKQQQLEQMQERLVGVIDPEQDSIRIYALCGPCRDRIVILGQGEVLRDMPVYVV
ncbi:MAG: CRISPR-associated endonuclease Cas2 [Actinobacteria bacterium]|nr:CRISPR-associated endonuclease Cas2 [Actinomycetota bacterium]